MAKLSIIILPVLALSLFFKPSYTQCERMFEMEPAVSDSPASTCNIRGQTVSLTCQVKDVGFIIGWYRTTNPSEAGMSTEDNKLEDDDTKYNIRAITTSNNGAINSVLSIMSFSPADAGYYWCEMTQISNPTASIPNPSHVVHLNATFALNPMQTCSSIDLSTPGDRCAYGADELNVETVLLNLLFDPPPPTTTMEPTTIPTTITTMEETTTMTTTTEEPTPMATTTEFVCNCTPVTTCMPEDIIIYVTPETVTTEEITTTVAVDTAESSGSSTLRTAVIWFTVGAVVSLLLTLGVVLCIVAIAKM